MMNISMGKLICKNETLCPYADHPKHSLSLSLSHTHTHTYTQCNNKYELYIIFIPIKIHVVECYFSGSTLVTNGKHRKTTIKNNNNINNNTLQIGMSFLFLIIIQCYVSGKPLILIINTFLKSTAILCEYVIVPSFYLGTYLNNVLYWVVLYEENIVISMIMMLSVSQHLLSTAALISMLQ